MDESTILTTIGKLYLEVSRLQQIAELQQRRIVELESQIELLSKPSDSTASRKKE